MEVDDRRRQIRGKTSLLQRAQVSEGIYSMCPSDARFLTCSFGVALVLFRVVLWQSARHVLQSGYPWLWHCRFNPGCP